MKRLSDEDIIAAWRDKDGISVMEAERNVARKAEQNMREQVIAGLYILIGNTTLKEGEEEGRELANRLRPFMQELKKKEGE